MQASQVILLHLQPAKCLASCSADHLYRKALSKAGGHHDKVCGAGPLEQALGLLATLMLRNPAAAELAADLGCIDSCIEVMQACERDNFLDSATGTQWVLRQVSPPAFEATVDILTSIRTASAILECEQTQTIRNLAGCSSFLLPAVPSWHALASRALMVLESCKGDLGSDQAGRELCKTAMH